MMGRAALFFAVAYAVNIAGLLLYTAVALMTSTWNHLLLLDHGFLLIEFLAIVK